MAQQNLSKSDIDEVLKVNEKAIILQTQNAEYFQEIIESLEKVQKEYRDLISSNSGLEHMIDKSIEDIKELSKKITISTDSSDELYEKLTSTVKQMENLEKELNYHMSDEEKLFSQINDNLKAIAVSANSTIGSFLELKSKLEISDKDFSQIKESMSDLKKSLESINKNIGVNEESIKSIKDSKYKTLLLLSSGVVAAGIPGIIELIKFIISLLHH
jgi:chromosome segregation ATPase